MVASKVYFPWNEEDPNGGGLSRKHVRAQIDAVYDAGLEEWILWSPSVRYPAEAFATADGVEPWFAGLGQSLFEEYERKREAERKDARKREVLGEPVSGG